MPEPLSPTIGFGMNVAVLPYECATLCTAYLRICIQSARCTSGANLRADLALAGGRDFVVVHFDFDAHLLEREHIAERMSCSESTGGTGK